MIQFLKSRTIWQWQLFGIWVLVVLLIATLDFKEGKVTEAIMGLIIQSCLFVFAAYSGYKNNK